MIRTACLILVCSSGIPIPIRAQERTDVPVSRDSVMIRFVDSDLSGAIQTLARYLDKPVIFSNLPEARVTLETPVPVPRSRVADLLRAVLASNDLEFVEDTTHYRVIGTARATRSLAGGQAGAGQPLELFVVRLSHAQSDDVAATVNALYGRAAAVGEIGVPVPTLNDQLRQSRVPPDAEAARPGDVVGRPGSVSGELVIVADSRSNSLLVRASPADFEVIRAAIQELDVRPLQVLIEVMIAEVRRDSGYDFGVELGLQPTRIPGTNTVVEGTTTGLGLGDLALHVMGVGGIDLDAVLHAEARRGNASILSRPVVLTANNETARILVGSQRPFVQVSRSLPTDAPSRDQVVQYKDVGTELTVIPTVSDDGYVMLSVTQEVNAATTETAFDAPVISTRSVQTRLLVRDGQTAVLGGLTDHQRDASSSGVPVLSSIPLLGGLFGRVSRRSTETELFVFLTPRVIRSDEDIESTSAPFRESADRIRRNQ